ncbi:MAG: hypothetical protein H6936_12995 [Burkholderiales bacterium]|nr:hypothetical protein [Nitrosomonas sp.]MCP5275738.1 hypothetical protein [Burkholderiales bacterium]
MALSKQIKEFNTYLKNNESVLDRDFKHVSDKIMLHWGYPEFYPFIKKLLVNNPDRNRKGFPIEAMQEIYKLYEIHTDLFPHMDSRD